jgi:uncharacterized protein YjbJ (UPF0337 family)
MKNIDGHMINWDETKRMLKQKFAKLTDNDILIIEGKQDELLSRLQVKLGKSREALLKLISEL